MNLSGFSDSKLETSRSSSIVRLETTGDFYHRTAIARVLQYFAMTSKARLSEFFLLGHLADSMTPIFHCLPLSYLHFSTILRLQ